MSEFIGKRCPACGHPYHSRFVYLRGWLAWLIVMAWPTRWLPWSLVPYAGDYAFDARNCWRAHLETF